MVRYQWALYLRDSEFISYLENYNCGSTDFVGISGLTWPDQGPVFYRKGVEKINVKLCPEGIFPRACSGFWLLFVMFCHRGHIFFSDQFNSIKMFTHQATRDDPGAVEVIGLIPMTSTEVMISAILSKIDFCAISSYRTDTQPCTWSHCVRLIETSTDMQFDLIRLQLELQVMWP